MSLDTSEDYSFVTSAKHHSPAGNHQHLHTPSIGPMNPATVSSTASQQHKQEQDLLSGFTVPEPPISTKESTRAAGSDLSSSQPHGTDAPRTLWMGDLDPWLDEANIVDLWWQILGQDVSVKLIRPRNYKTETEQGAFAHSGYCFVEFPSYEIAQQALGLNGQLLPDIAMPSQQNFRDNPDNQKKYFRLNWASGATLSAPIIDSPEYSLFVGDLSASTTEAHLLSFFQKSFPNSIRTVRVMTDPITGKSRCFGFVRFTNDADRQRALTEMNGAWFGGRPLRVANATPRAGSFYRRSPENKPMYAPHMSIERQPYDMMYMSGPPPQVNSGSPLPGFYSQAMLNGGVNEMTPIQYGMGMDNSRFSDQINTTVFVGGLSSEVSEQTLFTLFKAFGEIIQIKIPPGKNCGFIKYSARHEAEEAIQAMEGFVIGGHRVRLGWGRVSPCKKRFQRQHLLQMQMQAAAVMSMGIDPNSMFAASGYPPLPPQANTSSAQGYPPIPLGIASHGMPPHLVPPFSPGNPPPEPGFDNGRYNVHLPYSSQNASRNEDAEIGAEYLESTGSAPVDSEQQGELVSGINDLKIDDSRTGSAPSNDIDSSKDSQSGAESSEANATDNAEENVPIQDDAGEKTTKGNGEKSESD